MAYLELADGRKKKTLIPEYFRKGHWTGKHFRHLQDGNELLYIQVPDPNNKLKPAFVREDFFDKYPDEDFSKLIRFVTPFNNSKHLQEIADRRNARSNHYMMNDANLLSDIFSDVVGVVRAGANFVPGGSLVSGAIGALTGQTSTGTPTHQPVITNSTTPEIKAAADRYQADIDANQAQFVNLNTHTQPYNYSGSFDPSNRPGVKGYDTMPGVNTVAPISLMPGTGLPNRPGAQKAGFDLSSILTSKVFGIPTPLAIAAGVYFGRKFIR